MKQYEITILTKEEVKNPPTGGPVAKEIEALGGKIISSSTLGQKQLTYPIKKEKEAYFTTVIFEIDGEKMIELNRKLSLKEEILRHLIILKKTAKVKPEKAVKEPIKTPAEEKTPKEAKKIPELPEIAKMPEIPKPIKPPTVKPVTKKEKAPVELDEEERLTALDKKLDELLKE